MPESVCPNCKHNISMENAGDVCPACGWDLQTPLEQTLKTGSTETPSDIGDDAGDFLPPGVDHPAGNEKTLTDTAGTIDSPTLQRPEKTGAKKTTSEIAQTLPHGRLKTATPADPEDLDPNLMNTLASAKPESDANKTSNDIDPTLVPEKGKTPPTVQRSVKTVIPTRNISRKTEPGKLQDYKLGKRIGSGSFGVVYRALQVPLERTVALKVLTAESGSAERQEQIKSEFLREAQFTGRLEHPNIVPIHDIGLTEDRSGDPNRPFYVMKEIHGDSWMEKISKLSRNENLEIFKRVVNAMGFAHDKNVLHCDLKPENVMLGEFGEVLVVDWGQAIDLTQPESIRPGGTPAYISPEMAQYWCDIYLDHQETSPAHAMVGRRSDVYLLGALLFEIITGGLPRNADDEETQYDVIRRACENDIVEHDEFLNDELMQIARRALRLTDSDHIESIEQLQEAIKQFETRALSIELRERADQLLASAKANGSYDEFQKSRFGYEEALGKWDENTRAVEGLRDARLSCAALALDDQNFDLGIDMLADAETDAERRVKELLVAGRKRRDRRKQLVRWLALALVASIVVGLGLNIYMISLNLNTAKLRDLALAEKAEIEKEVEPLRQEVAANVEKIAQFPIMLREEQEKFDRELTRNREKLNEQLAKEQRKYDSQLTEEKQQFETKLNKEKIRYQNQVDQFDEQRDAYTAEIGELSGQLSQLSESAKLLKYKSAISDIRQELRSGNFREARSLLDAFSPKNAWEWSRLNLLAHREIASIYPRQAVVAVGASRDGKTFALAFPNRIEIRDTADFVAPPVVIPLSDVQAIALSADGRLLAIGRPATSLLEPGVIQIVEFSDPENPQLVKTLEAQSTAIFHMEFSPNSNRFLAVGRPSKLRKSSGGLEEELMVWTDQWKRIDVSLADGQGSSPKIQRASFSADGSRILTTNPNGLGREQYVHLFAISDDQYRWIAKSPVSHLNCATFRDDEGTEIMACARDSQAGSYTLVSWDPNRTLEVDRGVKSTNFISTANGDAEISLSTVSQLDNKVLDMWRAGNWLAFCGEDRQTTLWNLATGFSTSFRGHSRSVDSCSLLSGKSADEQVIISIASGPNPEILKTDLATYQQETDVISFGKTSRDDQPSPTALFRSRVTGKLAFGNDQGLAAIVMGKQADDTDLRSQLENGQTTQWEVTAWKNHVLTHDFLFAQSRRDEIFQFDRHTGNLVSVLTELARNRDEQTEITTFEVSDNGQFAVVSTNERIPRFEIWDLTERYPINIIDYGKENIFGSDTDKELLTVKISQNGKWIVAGKQGLFAWSTETGQQMVLNQPAADVARTPISSILFVPGTSRFLASWKGRIDLFDLTGKEPTQRFNLPLLAYSKTEPNLIDAIVEQGRVLVLAHWIRKSDSETGIALIELGSETPIQFFPQAKFASFSRGNSDDVLVISESDNLSRQFRYNQKTDQTTPLELQFDRSNEERFRSLRQIREFADGSIVAQSITRNPANPVRGNWNTISFDQNSTIARLRVFAKPIVEFCAIAGDNAITLEAGNLRFWKVTPGGVSPDGVHAENCRICALAGNEKLLALVPVTADRILFVDPFTRNTVTSIQDNTGARITAIRWSHDSQGLAIGYDSGIVQIWQRKNANDEFARTTTIDAMDGHQSLVLDLALSQNGESVLSLHESGFARVSHQAGGKWSSFLLRPEDGQKLVHGDISPDGKRAVTGSEFGRLTVWNTENLNSDGNDEHRNQTSGFERETMILQDKHQSSIRFVKFISNSAGQLELVSAEEDVGDNSFLVWNANPKQAE